MDVNAHISRFDNAFAVTAPRSPLLSAFVTTSPVGFCYLNWRVAPIIAASVAVVDIAACYLRLSLT